MKFYEVQPDLEAGKKIRRSSWSPSYYVTIVIDVMLHRDPIKHIALFGDSGFLDYWKASDEDLLADGWEIIEETKEADVKTETTEYYVCPYCTAKINLKNKEVSSVCGNCGKEVKLKREEKTVNNLDYALEVLKNCGQYTTKKQFGEIPEFRIIIPSLQVDNTLKPNQYRIRTTPETTTFFYNDTL